MTATPPLARAWPACRPMWCDRFDGDLPKVVPDARDIVGDLGDVVLWTFGHTTHGALNGANVWNGRGGLLAFFGFRNSGRPTGHVGSGELVRCTAWEALRDAWPHTHVLHVEQMPVWDTGALRSELQALVADVRGWRAEPGAAEAARDRARHSLMVAMDRFRVLVRAGGVAVERDGDGA